MDTVSSKELLLKEFAREMATTRTMLERVPFERFDWAPHAKSTPLGRLAIHLATLPGMGANVIERHSLSFGGARQQPEIKGEWRPCSALREERTKHADGDRRHDR
jgi:hypothetical protein